MTGDCGDSLRGKGPEAPEGLNKWRAAQEQTRGLPVPKRNMASVLEKMRNIHPQGGHHDSRTGARRHHPDAASAGVVQVSH